MKKQVWATPKLVELKVDKTAYGNSITKHVDGSVRVGEYTYYSFS